MKTLGLFLLPALASGAPLSIAAPPDAALTTPHRIEVLAEGPALTLSAAQGNKMGLLGVALARDFENTGHRIVADFIRSHRK